MKDQISFEDFTKLDIRIGTIVSAEHVPDTDKLLQLTIDLGQELGERHIVAGIAEYISDPQMLAGIQVPILANLEPRVLRGVKSHGMMLAVGSTDTDDKPSFTLLSPKDAVSVGSIVR